LQNVVATAEPAGVVIDLTELDYTYGDAIGGLALPFLNRIREGRRIMPVGIVATGPTATALAPLLGANWVLGLVGAKLFASRDAAVAYIRSALSLRGA